MSQLYSIGDVSRMTGVKPYQIEYAISVGKLPEPRTRFLGKRCFTEDDIRQIAQLFQREAGPEQGPPEGEP